MIDIINIFDEISIKINWSKMKDEADRKTLSTISEITRLILARK